MNAIDEHRALERAWQDRTASLTRRGNVLSLARLALFCAAIVSVGTWFSGRSGIAGALSLAFGCAFAILVLIHARLLAARGRAERARAVHVRYLERASSAWTGWTPNHRRARLEEHPYAEDLDLTGPGSLLARIDVTHSTRGFDTLFAWLSAGASCNVIAERQHAVEELSGRAAFLEALEVAAGSPADNADRKLDPDPFLKFLDHPFLFGPSQTSRLARLAVTAAPVLVGALCIATWLSVVPLGLTLSAVGAQGVIAVLSSRACRSRFDLVAAREGAAQAFRELVQVVEQAGLETPLLVGVRDRTRIGGRPGSHALRALETWVSFAELRGQFPLHLLANVALLWDLNVLARLEAWVDRFRTDAPRLFDALGEMEALASLAALRRVEPSSSYPTVSMAERGMEATALAHPLLDSTLRVPNDVHVRGPGTVLVVTGSNMAGKSTLLRAVGLNLALALAGGPVCARFLRLEPIRLRASMRIADSLQRGASYFHAELTKLRTVVAFASASPPVFFLLDEVLRGTGAHARHIGARAVLDHLLRRGAMGVVATHDLALADLVREWPDRIENVHFTDVLRDGEMTFDYTLRPGVVAGSNALRLLELAGIEIPSPI